MEKILVTGCAGFIGHAVCKNLLAKQIQIIGIDNLNSYYDVKLKLSRLAELEKLDNFTFIKCDITNQDKLSNITNQHPDIKNIIHLAAQAGVRYSVDAPMEYIKSNLEGHTCILELCREIDSFEHLVYASSSSVYGANDKVPFSIADEVCQPKSLYAATKRSCELMSHTYSHLYNIKATGLRFFTVYGPWGRPDMAAFLFTKAIFEDKPITVFNDGNMQRDFTYIDDIVDGIIASLNSPSHKNPPHRLFNLGNNKPENLMDFINIIENAIGKKAVINYRPMHDGDVVKTYADISESIEQLGYNPKTSLNDGIPRFVNWFKDRYIS